MFQMVEKNRNNRKPMTRTEIEIKIFHFTVSIPRRNNHRNEKPRVLCDDNSTLLRAEGRCFYAGTVRPRVKPLIGANWSV